MANSQDVVIETDPHSHLRQFGGAISDDDLEVDEPAVKPAKPAAPVAQVPPRVKTRKERIYQGLHIFKIAALCGIWIIFTVLLMMCPEYKPNPMFVSVPSNGTKIVTMPIENDKIERLGLFISGPFISGRILANDAAQDDHTVKIAIDRLHYDGDNNLKETLPTKSDWHISLVEVNKIDKAELKDLYEVYELHPRSENAKRSTLQLRLQANTIIDIPLKIWFTESPLDKSRGIVYGAIILVFLYAMIIWEFINRTLASIIAATLSLGILAILHERPPMSKIIKWIDCETMLLLFGMMLMVAVLSESGIFDYSAVFAYKIAKGRVWVLINCLCIFTATLSSFFDNVTMMLLATPVTIRLCDVMELNPIPVLMCMVIYSNVGAAITPVGDPPNVIISTNEHIADSGVNFANFIAHLLPGTILAMTQTYFQVRFIYRDLNKLRMKAPDELQHELMVWENVADGVVGYSKDEKLVREALQKKVENLKGRISLKDHVDTVDQKKATFEETLKELTEAYPIRNKALLIKSLIGFSFVMIIFLLHSVKHLLHLSLGWTALIGAILLLIIGNVDDIEAILRRVEWSTLIFFASLLITMECLAEMGLIEVIGKFVEKMILLVSEKYRLTLAILIILWVSAIASAFLDNIPVATMMVKIVVALSLNEELNLPLHPLVWSLAFGCCYGGNGTLIGASANVVCAGVAEQHGFKITFIDFFLIGFPIMLMNIVVAMIYLLLAHVVFEWH